MIHRLFVRCAAAGLAALALISPALAAPAEETPLAAARSEAAGLLARLYPDRLPFKDASPREAAPSDEATTATDASAIPMIPAVLETSLPREIPAVTTATLSAARPEATTATMGGAPLKVTGILRGAAPEVPLEVLTSATAEEARDSIRPIDPAILVTRTPRLASGDADARANELKYGGGRGTVRINFAEAPELEEKLKIDGRRARFIMEFRQAYGPFKTMEDLAQVNGITDTMLDIWEKSHLLSLD